MRRGSTNRSRAEFPVPKKAEFSPVSRIKFPCYSAVNSPVIPGLLWADEFPCSGGIHILVARRRTRFLSRLASPCGFRTRRGERRPAMLPQFENLMIFLFENIKVCHIVFSRSERLHMLIGGEW